MSNTVSIKSIDLNNVSFAVGQAKAGRNPPITMKYSGQNLNIGLTNIRAPGGVLIRDNEGAATTYTLMCSLPNCPRDGTGEATGTDDASLFYNFMLALENKLVEVATEQSVKWFGKRRSAEAVRDGFKRMVNVSATKVDGEYVPNGKYDPSFRVKVPVYEGSVRAPVEDNMKNPVYVSPETLPTVFPKGVVCGLVLSGSVYVLAGGGFGVTWRLQAAQVFPPARARMTDFFAAQEAPEEEENLEEGGEVVDVDAAAGGGGGGRPATPPDQPVQAQEPSAPARKRRVAPAAM